MSFMAMAGPALAGAAVPLIEKGMDRMWGLTERGVGWLADKIFGSSSDNRVTNRPEYSR